MLAVPESRDERKISLDLPGAALGTAGVTALIFGIIQGVELGWTSIEIISVFTAAVILLGAFAWVELRSEHPMLPLRFFRQKDFSGAVLVISLIVFAMIVAFFYLTQFFQIVQGRSAMEAGLDLAVASRADHQLLQDRVGPVELFLEKVVHLVPDLLDALPGIGLNIDSQVTVSGDTLVPGSVTLRIIIPKIIIRATNNQVFQE